MRKDIQLKEDERIDELQRNGYGIIQSGSNFRFGMDAVLLSGFAQVKKGETAIDLGTGTGIIPILLEAKTLGSRFYGLEIQPDMADMASRSVRLNNLEEKIEIICGDIRELVARTLDKKQGSIDVLAGEEETDSFVKESIDGSASGMDGLKPLIGCTDVVTSNPPYMKAGSGIVNPDDAKAMARHETKCTLRDVCQAAAALLRAGGRFYMVHRPLRLAEIITELRSAKLEPKRIKPVYPFIDKEANMILIEAVKGGAAELRFEKPIIVYREQGVYTDEIYDIYGY